MKLASLTTGTTGLVLTTFIVPVATAQESYFDRDRYTAVYERAQPEFDPEPLRAGAFELSPELEAGVGTISNLFAATTDEVEDVVLVAAPKLRGETTWSRHSLNFAANVRHLEYADTDDESNTNLGALVGGRLDATSSLNFTGEVRADQTFENRASAASVPDAVEPVEVDRLGGQLGANYTSGRLRVNASASIDRFDYFDVPLNSGPILDQDFRDRDQTELKARVSWAANRDAAFFVEAGQINRDYDAPTLLNPLNRDSEGTILRVGTDFELPVLLRGDVAVGYQSFDFDDPTISEVEGLSVEARVQWFVTQLLTLTGTGSQTVEDPGLQAAPGAEVARWGLRGDYEARRNLLLFADVAISNFDYQDINRSDDRFDIGIGGAYKLNKRIWLEAAYRHTDQDSDFQDFSDNRLLVSLKLFP